WSLERELTILDPLSDREYEGDDLAFSARIEADERHQPRASSFRYALRRFGRTVLDLTVAEKTDGTKHRRKPEFELSSKRYSLTRHPGRAWALPGPRRFYGFPDEVAAYYQNAAFAAELVL